MSKKLDSTQFVKTRGKKSHTLTVRLQIDRTLGSGVGNI